MSIQSLYITPSLFRQRQIIILISLVIVIGNIGFWTDEPLIGLIVPSLVVTIYMAIYRLKVLFYWLFFFIPISMELELPGGISTDLFGEPILWILTPITVLLVISKGLPNELRNRTSLLLCLHLIWIIFASVLAHHPLISLKYFLAKIWYILPFYVLPFYIIKSSSDVRKVFKFFLGGLLIGGLYFFIQHFLQDLTYLTRTNAGQPIWRNHVNYACTLVLALPLLFYLFRTSSHPDRWIYGVFSLVILFFMYFAYARIAYLCIATGIAYFFVLKWRATKLAILLSMIGVLIGSFWLQSNNRYLKLAPNQEKAIMQINFEKKLTSTVTGEDISTMERVHRWVAGYHMVRDNPFTGVGPANFYRVYRPYSVYSFETYVSSNEERSGIHNYYLMTLVEQGVLGFLILLLLLCSSLTKIEYLCHQRAGISNKTLVTITGILLVMIITINGVNDMLEVIKVGGLFFFTLAFPYLKLKKATTN